MAKTNSQRKQLLSTAADIAAPAKERKERPVQPVLPGQKYMTSQQVRQRYGLKSVMWLHNKERHDPKFPKPRFDGGHKLYLVAEFDAYDEELEKSLSRPAKAEAQ